MYIKIHKYIYIYKIDDKESRYGHTMNFVE
jgi:hypothetical protein